MVTSRIPTYSLNTEFNREFRSFRVSSNNSHIVPVHEFSRVSLQERRAALRAAFAKDNAPERPKASEGRPLFFRCDSLQERRAALQAAFERNAEKARFDAKAVKKPDSGSDTKLDNRLTNRKETIIPITKNESRDKIFAKVDTVIETRGDLRKDDRNNNVLSVRSNFPKKYPIKESKPEVRSILTERLINKLENKFDNRYQVSDRRAVLATESLGDIRTNTKRELMKLPKIDFRIVSGAESLKDICSDLKHELRKLKRPEYEYGKMGVAGSMNDVRTRLEMSKSRVLTTEEPNTDGWSTPDSGVALGDSPPEDRRKGTDLPSMYLSLASWTPKSSLFQNRLKEHEWSISYVFNGFCITMFLHQRSANRLYTDTPLHFFNIVSPVFGVSQLHQDES